MAAALLSAIVEKLGVFISLEFALAASVEKEVQKLETKFRTIQAVLNDAEKRQLKEEAVNLWLHKLVAVSYEMDGALDEWNTAMIKEEIEKQQKEDEKAETSTSKKRKVWPLISVSNPIQHLVIAYKIEELNEKLDELNKEREAYGFELSRAIEKVVDASDILGRDKVKDDLVSILLGKGTEKEKRPHVISLVGMGGMGKTTLARLAFNHHEVMDHFEERIWVCVSEPFDQCRVAKAIIETLAGGDPKITELQSLLEKICELIGGKKFFLVLDNVWIENYAMWKPFRDALKSCGSQSSRILVTTRNEKVAQMMESAITIKLGELSEEDCWLVFSKIAFSGKDLEQCEQLEALGRQISKKCKGLPLAAKNLGSLMHFKKSRDEWKNVLDSNLGELDDIESGHFLPLLLSDYYLPSPLKRCFSKANSSDILGRDKVKDDLVSILLGKCTEKEEISPHVISLVGMGGIGKTTLAQLAYNNPEVKAHFDIKVWVCVSEHFDRCKIAKAIIEALGGGNLNLSEFQSLLKKICQLIGGKKFFLVLDDLWIEDFTLWEPFRNALQNCAQGSRILVITRFDRVAVEMDARRIKLEKLSDEDCWLVFSKIAFIDKDFGQCKELEDIGREISKKCKGLPLAAEILGGLMYFKKSRQQWEMVLYSAWWKLEDVGSGLFVPLLLSYHDLPLPLKWCFSYCAVFPKDFVFSNDDLVLMWMAQGYIDSKEMEDTARKYLQILTICSFFQNIKKGEDDDEIKWCKMHDIVHHFVQVLTKNECIVNSGVELGLDYENTHHLQLEIPKESQFPESVYNAKNLCTLILVYRSGYNLSNLFQHFRCLRILTLNCQDDDMFKELPDAVENFIHLRYLNLVNYCGYVLPNTICNLRNLQILKISFGIARVKKLPQGMYKLINLRHLILDCLYFGLDLEFPRGFGRLVSLRTLSHFNISGKDDSEGCKLGELQNLKHLQGALQIRGLGNVLDAREAEKAELKKKIHLRTLFLRFDGRDCEDIRNNDGLILNGLEPPQCLEYLCIEEYRATTMSTSWMMSLTNLKKLDIRYACLEHLPPLGSLPILESLHIDNAIYLKKVGVEFLGIESKKKKDNIIVFPRLKYLTFESLYEWKEWIGIGGEEEEEDCITIMPCLEKLTICSCEILLSLPDFLRMTPLKQLVIRSCCYLSKWCEEAEWPKISHIPITKIQFTGEDYKEDYDEDEDDKELHDKEEDL